MNTLLILIVIVVAFSYYGGKNVPSLLRNNKEILLGVLVGYCLHFFTGNLIEGNGHGSGHLNNNQYIGPGGETWTVENNNFLHKYLASTQDNTGTRLNGN